MYFVLWNFAMRTRLPFSDQGPDVRQVFQPDNAGLVGESQVSSTRKNPEEAK